MPHHGDEHGHVGGREPHARADVGDELDADLGVVAGVALADVVQERAEHQQVGPVGAGDERGRVGAGLHQVPVDGEAVVGVALRLAAHRLPLREHVHPEAHLVERLDDGDRAVAGEQQVDERAADVVGPRHRAAAPAAAASRSSDPRWMRVSPAGGGRRGPQHEARVGRGVGVGGEVDLAVAQHEPGTDGAVAPGPPPRRAAERRVDPLPGVVAAPRDRAGGGRQRVHERVGGRVAQRGGHAVLLLEEQPVAGAAGAAVQLHAGREQRVVGVVEGGVVALPQQAPGRLGPAEGVDVAEAAATLLEVGLEEERDLAGRLVALRAPGGTAPRASAWRASATGRALGGPGRR